MSCEHGESADPRKRGTCVRCGRLIPPVPSRDIALEEELLDVGCRFGQPVGAVVPGQFSRFVLERLAWGDAHFGAAFFERDNLAEAEEEAFDAAAYPLLELERLRPRLSEDRWQELRMLAIELVSVAARYYTVCRRMEAVRDGAD